MPVILGLVATCVPLGQALTGYPIVVVVEAMDIAVGGVAVVEAGLGLGLGLTEVGAVVDVVRAGVGGRGCGGGAAQLMLADIVPWPHEHRPGRAGWLHL